MRALWLIIFGGSWLFIAIALIGGSASGQTTQEGQPKKFDSARFLERFDKNKDGYVDRAEASEQMKQRFDDVDTNKDGKLSREELEKFGAVLVPGKKKGGRPGEVITPAAKGERLKDTLKVGDPAPDFTLPDLQGNREITLSIFRGKKPVVLIFASYT